MTELELTQSLEAGMFGGPDLDPAWLAAELNANRIKFIAASVAVATTAIILI